MKIRTFVAVALLSFSFISNSAFGFRAKVAERVEGEFSAGGGGVGGHDGAAMSKAFSKDTVELFNQLIEEKQNCANRVQETESEFRQAADKDLNAAGVPEDERVEQVDQLVEETDFK